MELGRLPISLYILLRKADMAFRADAGDTENAFHLPPQEKGEFRLHRIEMRMDRPFEDTNVGSRQNGPGKSGR